jgi:hypothetical protein
MARAIPLMNRLPRIRIRSDPDRTLLRSFQAREVVAGSIPPLKLGLTRDENTAGGRGVEAPCSWRAPGGAEPSAGKARGSRRR